jgi:hypothetical protein
MKLLMSQQTKDFVRFLGLVAILYLGNFGCTPSRRPAGSLLIALGFDTTFTFLARGHYSFGKMNWILVKVFFGSGYLVRIDKLPASVCSPALTPQAVSSCLLNQADTLLLPPRTRPTSNTTAEAL